MLKVLRLLKYLEYIELLESIAVALKKYRAGEDWEVAKNLSINGRKKFLRISCADVENETGNAVFHTEGQ